MRILMAHNHYQQPGGEDAVVLAETELLRSRGHTVIEYRRSNQELARTSLWDKATLPRRMIWANDSLLDLERLITTEQPQIAHFHNTFLMISPAAYRVCQQHQVPVVQTLHNYRLLCPSATFFRQGSVCEDCTRKIVPWPSVKHRCYRNSRLLSAATAAMLTVHRGLGTWATQVDAYITPSEFTRNKYIENGILAAKIFTKPHFIQTWPPVRSDAGDYMLFIGRLSEEKGIQTLLDGWRYLPRIPLKIVGDGPLMPQVTATATHYGLTDRVETVGRQATEALSGLIQGARGLIVPSVCYETFGLTIIEAFAHGVPVIASEHGAMAELISRGQTGLLFPAGNAQALAKQTKWLWQNPQRAIEMGRNAREVFETTYTAERNYELLMAIYDTVLQPAI